MQEIVEEKEIRLLKVAVEDTIKKIMKCIQKWDIK